MKATSFAWGNPTRQGGVSVNRPAQPASTPAPGFFARLDSWFWRQAQREREAYLAGAQDLYELEERMRRLERPVGGWYH